MKYILMVMIASSSGYAVTSHEFGDEASCKLAETTMKRQFKAAQATQALRTWCARYGGAGGSAGDWTPQ
ncbi:MAG: hypothetical protein ACR2OF_06970 [Hyphomicrobium sp.]